MQSYQVTDRRPIASVFRNLGSLPVNWCVQHGVHPNSISIASVVASVAASLCFLFTGVIPMLGLLGVGFCLLRLYCNMLDGMVAIAGRKASLTGEIANEFPDRISDVVIFAGAGYGMMCIPGLGLWCAILSLLVAYVGTLGKAIGVHRDFAGPMSKPWRMIWLFVGVIATVYQFSQPDSGPMVMAPVTGVDIACFLIAIGCAVTIVRRLLRIINAARSSSKTRA